MPEGHISQKWIRWWTAINAARRQWVLAHKGYLSLDMLNTVGIKLNFKKVSFSETCQYQHHEWTVERFHQD